MTNCYEKELEIMIINSLHLIDFLIDFLINFLINFLIDFR